MLPTPFLCLLATSVLGFPLQQRAAGPSVTIANGTIIGSSTGTVDTFKGIPYAQPPIGELRLRAPQPITASLGTVVATSIPTACPQFFSQVNTTDLPSDVVGELEDSPIAQQVTLQGEDCLTLNVQRPSNVTAESKLPVVFWIFGGRCAPFMTLFTAPRC